MMTLLDAVVILGVGHYAFSRIGSQSEEAKQRLTYTLIAGGAAAIAGPYVVGKVHEITSGKLTHEQKQKLVSSAVLGAAGYLFGDKLAAYANGKNLQGTTQVQD